MENPTARHRLIRIALIMIGLVMVFNLGTACEAHGPTETTTVVKHSRLVDNQQGHYLLLRYTYSDRTVSTQWTLVSPQVYDACQDGQDWPACEYAT